MASQPTAVDNTKYPSEQHLDGYHSGFTSPVSPYNQDYSAQPAIPGSPQYIRDYNAHNAPEVLLHETGKIVVTPDCLPAGLIPITKYDVGAYSTPQVDYSSVPEVVGDPEKGERGAGLCCGLRKKWFIILTVLLALIVIGAVAGGVASSSTKKKSTNETSQEKQGYVRAPRMVSVVIDIACL